MRVSFFIQKRSPVRFGLQLPGASKVPQPRAPEDLEPIPIGQGLPLVMYAYRVKSPALRGSYFRLPLTRLAKRSTKPPTSRRPRPEAGAALAGNVERCALSRVP